MEKFLDRIGFFDVLGMLFPGFMFLLSLNIFYNFVQFNKLEILRINNLYDVAIYIIISYFLGVVFHELSNSIKRFIYPLGTPQANYLLSNSQYCNDDVKKIYKTIIMKEFGEDFKKLDKEKNDFIYSYFLHYIYINEVYHKTDKIISVHNMSRSLFISYLILFVVCILNVFYFAISNIYFNIFNLATFLVVIVVIIMILYKRMKRFYKFIVQNVYLAFLIDYKNKKSNYRGTAHISDKTHAKRKNR